jgi:hypothetical protein
MVGETHPDSAGPGGTRSRIPVALTRLPLPARTKWRTESAIRIGGIVEAAGQRPFVAQVLADPVSQCNAILHDQYPHLHIVRQRR